MIVVRNEYEIWVLGIAYILQQETNLDPYELMILHVYFIT